MPINQNLVVTWALLFAPLVSATQSALERENLIESFNQAQRCYASAVEDDAQSEQAIGCAGEALQHGRSLFAPVSEELADLLYNYGDSLAGVDSSKRNTSLREALSIYEQIHGEDSTELINLLMDLGEHERAIDISGSGHGATSLVHAKHLLSASISLSDGLNANDRKGVLAEAYALSAKQLFDREHGAESWGGGLASFQIGKIKAITKDYKSAIPYLRTASKIPSKELYAHRLLVEAYHFSDEDAKATEHAQLLGKLLSGRELSDYEPIITVKAKYPELALKNADEGYVVIQLTVSKQGRVVDPRVLEEKPKYRGFAKAALKAVKSNRYAPRFRDGEVEETPGVLYKYTFQMAP